jgi:hypothetical protein
MSGAPILIYPATFFFFFFFSLYFLGVGGPSYVVDLQLLYTSLSLTGRPALLRPGR